MFHDHTFQNGEDRSRSQMRSTIHYQASFFWPVANLRPNSKILAFFFMLSASSVPTETHLTQMTRSGTQSTVVSLPSRSEDGEGNTAQGWTKHTSDSSPYLSIRHWAKNEGSFLLGTRDSPFILLCRFHSPLFSPTVNGTNQRMDGWRRWEREKRPVL